MDLRPFCDEKKNTHTCASMETWCTLSNTKRTLTRVQKAKFSWPTAARLCGPLCQGPRAVKLRGMFEQASFSTNLRTDCPCLAWKAKFLLPTHSRCGQKRIFYHVDVPLKVFCPSRARETLRQTVRRSP